MSVDYFFDGFHSIVEGFLHVSSSKILRSPSILFKIVSYVLRVFLFFLPLSHAKLPKEYCHPLLPVDTGGNGNYEAIKALVGKRKWPVLIFSHGLTGNGAEQTTLFVSLCRAGFIVACIHHTDGSSAKYYLDDGSVHYYHHPILDHSVKQFRLDQVVKREAELFQMRQHVISTFHEIVDESLVFVGGFSYGACTASLSAYKRDDLYAGVVLLDGWFCLDMPNIDGTEAAAFPNEEVHRNGLKQPCLFIGSEVFANNAQGPYTRSLIQKSKERSHNQDDIIVESVVIPDSVHYNFTDAVLWFPKSLLLPTKFTGKCDPYLVHQQITKLVTDFLQRIVSQKQLSE